MDNAKEDSLDWIKATYRLQASNQSEAEALTTAIAYEQTVELPPEQITDETLLREVVAQVDELTPDPNQDCCWRLYLRYNAQLADAHLSHLFNLIYGNISMYSGVRLMDLALPESMLRQFRGPKLGITGIRGLLNVPDRPLLCSVVKPRGLSIQQMTELITEFAQGGGDLIKDDQNLSGASFEDFGERVEQCAEAMLRANQTRGTHPCLYFPHLAGPDEQLEQRAEFVRSLNLKGVLVCPITMGMDRARRLTQQYDLAMMAHPSHTGSLTNRRIDGIEHGVLMGTLFRLAGSDIVAATGFGGRFAYTQEQCMGMRDAMVEPLGQLKRTFLAPAGGIRLELVPELVNTYGRDLILLVGGDLLGRPEGVRESTRQFAAAAAAA